MKDSLYQSARALRNPSFNGIYRDLQESDFSSIDTLRSLQLEKLNKLIYHAKKTSLFYAKRLANLGGELQCLTEIAKLPIIEKRDLIEFNSAVHSQAKFKRLFFSETSGSTGQTLTFFKDEIWDSANRASIERGYSWHGVKSADRNVYFWGFNFSKSRRVQTRVLDFLQNRRRCFSYRKEELRGVIENLRGAKYLHGYSSMLYVAAKEARSMGYGPSDFPSLHFIKGTSERIYPYYHQAVKDAFGGVIRSEYGAAEAGIIAFECPEGKMHVNMENCIVEIDDHNDILVTNLNSYSFPILRYRLGDHVQILRNGKCRCGRHTDIVVDVVGRSGGLIYGKQNRYPSLTIYYILKTLYFDFNLSLSLQFIQRHKGELTVCSEQVLSNGDREAIDSQMRLYFKKDLTWKVVEGKPLLRDGKLRDFLSEIDY